MTMGDQMTWSRPLPKIPPIESPRHIYPMPGLFRSQQVSGPAAGSAECHGLDVRGVLSSFLGWVPAVFTQT